MRAPLITQMCVSHMRGCWTTVHIPETGKMVKVITHAVVAPDTFSLNCRANTSIWEKWRCTTKRALSWLSNPPLFQALGGEDPHQSVSTGKVAVGVTAVRGATRTWSLTSGQSVMLDPLSFTTERTAASIEFEVPRSGSTLVKPVQEQESGSLKWITLI